MLLLMLNLRFTHSDSLVDLLIFAAVFYTRSSRYDFGVKPQLSLEPNLAVRVLFAATAQSTKLQFCI